MAREIIQRVWCDPCLINSEGEEHSDATETVITVGSMKPRNLALCDRHAKEMLDPLVEVLKEVAIAEPAVQARVATAVAPSDRITCAECGRTLKNRGSLGSHVRNGHGFTLAEYWGKHPDAEGRDSARDLQLPLDNDVERTTVACDLCDWVSPNPVMPNRVKQTLGVHKAKAHGIRGAHHKE